MGDQDGRGQRARGNQRSGTGDEALKTRIWNRKQSPAASIPPPEATSRTAGPPGAFLWGAWLTPSSCPSHKIFTRGQSRCARVSEKVTFLEPVDGSKLHSRENTKNKSKQTVQLRLVCWTPVLDGSRCPAGLRLIAGSSNHNPVCLYFLFLSSIAPWLLF